MNELEIRNKLITEMSAKKKKLKINNIFNYITSFLTGSLVGMLIMYHNSIRIILSLIVFYIFILTILWFSYTALSNHELDKLVKVVIKNTKDIENPKDVQIAIDLVVRLL